MAVKEEEKEDHIENVLEVERHEQKNSKTESTAASDQQNEPKIIFT